MLLHQRFQQHLVVGQLMLGVPSRGGRRSCALLHLLELPTIAKKLVCVWNTLSTLQVLNLATTVMSLTFNLKISSSDDQSPTRPVASKT